MSEAPTHTRKGPGSTSATSSIQLLISQWRRHLAAIGFLRRLSHILGLALLSMLLMVVADHAWPRGLPQSLLGPIGWTWLAITATAILVALGAAISRRISPLYAARTAEDSEGIGHNVLVNLVLVENDPGRAYAGPAVARHVVRELNDSRERPRMEGRPSRPRWSTTSVWIAGVIGLWVLYAGLGNKPIGPSIARMFGAAIEAPTATVLRLISPDAAAAVYAGEPLTLAFEVSGAGAEQLEFILGDGGDGPARGNASREIVARVLARTAMRGQPDVRSLSLAAHEVAPPFRVIARAGDAEIRPTIELHPIPAAESLSFKIHPPPYLRLSPSLASSGTIHVWSGSRVEIDGIANTNVHLPTLVMRTGQESRSRMIVSSDQVRALRAEAMLTESGEIWVEFNDRFGRAAASPHRTRVMVRRDTPPRVEWTTPPPDESSDDRFEIDQLSELAVSIVDDVAVTSATLVIETSGVLRRNLVFRADPERFEVRVAARGSIEQIALQPGQSARVWFEATDNRHHPDGQPAPQVATSGTILVTRPMLIAAGSGRTLPRGSAAKGTDTGKGSTLVARNREVDSAADGSESSGSGGDSLASGDKGSTKGTDQPTDTRSSSTGGTSSDTSASEGADNPDPDSVSGRPGGKDSSADSDKSGDAAQPPDPSRDSERGEEAAGTEGPGNNPEGTGDRRLSDADPATERPVRESVDREMREFEQKNEKEIKEAAEHLRNRDEDSRQPPNGSRDASPKPQAEKDSSDAESPAEKAKPEEPERTETSSDRTPEQGNTEPQAGNSEQRERNASNPEQTTKPQSKEEARRSNDPESSAPNSKQSSQKGSGKPSEQPSQSGAGKSTPDSSDTGSNARGNQGDSTAQTDSATGQSSDSNRAARTGKSSDENSKKQPPGNSSPNGSTSPDGTGTRSAAGGGARPNGETSSDPQPDPKAGDAGRTSKDETAPANDPVGSTQQPAETHEPDLISILLRAQEEPDSLESLPMDAARKKVFQRELERLAARAESAGVLSEARRRKTRSQLGDQSLRSGSMVRPDVASEVRAGALPADAIEQMAAAPEQTISAELRGVLDAYYQSMARRRLTTSQPSTKSP